MEISKFCADEIWNPNLTWYTEQPKLTKCLSQVVFTIGPSGILFFLSIFEFIFIFQSKNKKIHFNNYNIVRLLTCLFGIWSNASLFFDYLISDDGSFTLSDLIGCSSKIFSFVLLAVVYHFQRINGIITSGIIFFALSILTTSSFILLIDTLLYNSSMYTNFESNNIHRVFFCFLFLLILSCFSDDPIDAGLKPSKNYENLCKDKKSKESNDDNLPEISPKQYCSFISKITFFWYFELVRRAKKRELKMNEIYQLEKNMRTVNAIEKFNFHYYKEIENIKKSNEKSNKENKFKTINLMKIILKTHWANLLLVLLLKTMADSLTLCQPWLLKIMLDFLKDTQAFKWHGVLIILCFILNSSLSNIFANFTMMSSFETTVNLTATLSNMVFYKALRLKPKSKRDITIGQIMNLYAVDSRRFQDWTSIFVYVWSSPFQIVIGFFLLYSTLGNATFFAIIAISVIMILQYLLNRHRERYTITAMKMNDERMMLINETLAGIKIIKLSAWEKAFIDKITKERNKQIHYLKLVYYLDMMVNWVFFSFSPFLILTTSISVYIFFIDPSQFTSQKAFVAISILNILDGPIEQLPSLLSYYFTCKVSVDRLSNFFRENEHEKYVKRIPDDKFALSIKGKATFSWGGSSKGEEVENEGFEMKEESNYTNECETSFTQGKKNFELNEIEIEIRKGSMVAIIGSVGSGKSSLISAILGEMYLVEDNKGVKGEVNISEEQTICYVAQQAWIQNCSFKDNILFGKSLDENIYEEVINACALETDLQQFEARDETEIGEKGINLSGGQKQRVSLARACYWSLSIGDGKQIILLDDPLSAVDAHVGKHLCENVLNSSTGILKNTTRVLVTNQLNQLSALGVDEIILLKEGKIVLKCSYDEFLVMKNSGALTQFDLQLTENQSAKEDKEEKKPVELEILESNGNSKNKNISENNLKNKKLIENEKREVGNVRFENYKIYFKYFGFIYALLGFCLMSAENIMQIYSRVYLVQWTETKLKATDPESIKLHNRNNLLTFAGLSFSECILNILANLFIIFGILSSLKLFHETLLHRILRSPMSFFDTTPVGRILNRFSRDIEAIDELLPISTRELLIHLLRLISTIVILIIKQPNTLMFYFLIFVAYFFTMKIFIKSSRSLKRYQSTTRSPIYSRLSETYSGVSTIRAYSKLNDFENDLIEKVDINKRCFWLYISGNRWLKFYLDLMTSVILLVVTSQFIISKERTTAGDAGLIITYIMNLTSNLNYVVRFLGSFETNSVSIERINEYCNNVEEDVWEKSLKPDKNWPKKGEIEFKNYSTRYRENTNLVLRDINFKVNATEKIGIIGRTGAGKSSITLALFRIIEPVEGQILIDNIDISTIGLYDLRCKLSIIPQDPILFSGTIRFNLDPFNKHSDFEIYQSIENAHLKNYVNSLSDGINHKVSEGGENLSVGQRQLICLARALLRKSKILVLDEATASVDFHTDELVQKTIRTEFKDCTIITIAHRLKTVIDSSKILVLEKGKLQEYDTPQILLKKTDSLFYSFAVKANLI